ncbi:MAG: hypothetical protein OXU74_11235 [Gemmatimonadota bacterium]|nr:hypothetical protein [Gemmatimonadota bacterium]
MSITPRIVPVSLLAALLIALCLVLAACEPEIMTETHPAIEYAAVPAIALSPDSFAVRRGDWLHNESGLSRPSQYAGTPGVHVTYTRSENEPWIIRCDREPGAGFPDCAEMERAGFIVIGQAAVDAVTANLSGCTTGDTNAVGGRLVLTVSSCFGLVRWQHFWDTTKVEFIPAPWRNIERSHAPRVIGCGTSWYGYRLLHRSGSGSFPLDAMFSDTVWMTTTDC